MVSELELEMRQNCFSPGSMCSMAGTKLLEFGSVGEVPRRDVAVWAWVSRHILIADQQDAMAQAADGRLHIVDAVHNDRPGGAAL